MNLLNLDFLFNQYLGYIKDMSFYSAIGIVLMIFLAIVYICLKDGSISKDIGTLILLLFGILLFILIFSTIFMIVLFPLFWLSSVLTTIIGTTYKLYWTMTPSMSIFLSIVSIVLSIIIYFGIIVKLFRIADDNM